MLSPKAKLSIIIGAVFSVVVIPLAVWGISALGQKRQPAQNGSEQQNTAEAEPEPEIETEPLEEDVMNLLFCGLDDAAGLTDVIMVVSFDIKAGKVNVLQIPRDTYIGDFYKTGKINQVYFSHRGEKEPVLGLAEVISDQFRLPIDGYCVITLKGFRDIIDALGGVTIDIPQRIEFLPGKVIEAGKQHLNGERAEWFVRYRAGYASGDIGRVNAQRLMLDALVKTVKDKGRSGMLLLATQNFGKVATNIPLTKALSLANEGMKLQSGSIQVFTLEGIGKMHNGFAVYEVDRARLAKLLNLHFRPYGEKLEWLPTARVPAEAPVIPPPDSDEQEQPETEPGLEPENPEYSESQPDAGENTGDFPID